MALMPVSAPIKVLVRADTMLSPELGVGHEAARVHHALRRRSSGMAAYSACTTAADADDRLAPQRIGRSVWPARNRIPGRPTARRIRREPEHRDRATLGGRSLRPPA